MTVRTAENASEFIANLVRSMRTLLISRFHHRDATKTIRSYCCRSKAFHTSTDFYVLFVWDHVAIRSDDRLVIGCNVLPFDRDLFAGRHRYRQMVKEEL